MVGNDHISNSDNSETICYRLSVEYLYIGVFGFLFFATIDVASVYAAYNNIDGSFDPVFHSLFCGICFSSFAFLDLFLIFAYFRERLYVSHDSITQKGLFRTKRINNPAVYKVVWRLLPRGGGIVIRSHSFRIKIDLGNFTQAERKELIARLRDAFSPDIQTGWERFIEARNATPKPPVKSRWIALLCAILYFAAASMPRLLWREGFGIGWLVLAIILVIAAFCYIWRFFHWRKSK